jgi:hypothetical protein
MTQPSLSDSNRKERYGTEPKMKKAIARAKGENPQDTKENALKTLGRKTKDLDTTPPITYAREFVEWMLEHEKAELDTIISLVSQAVSNIKELEKQNE